MKGSYGCRCFVWPYCICVSMEADAVSMVIFSSGPAKNDNKV
jgi:hypothetical protein